MPRRVVITGLGVVSPIGVGVESLSAALVSGRSGVKRLAGLPGHAGGAVPELGRSLAGFGPLPPQIAKPLRKSLKQMSRDTVLGLAALLQAWRSSGLDACEAAAERRGVVQGAGYVGVNPADFAAGLRACQEHAGGDAAAAIQAWGEHGVGQVPPLWMLSCLPNLVGCYAAILLGCRGPNNTLTVGGAAANLAIADACEAIRDDEADVMLAGGCGSRLDSYSLLHVMGGGEVAAETEAGPPARLLRPFDAGRTGCLPAEGAAALVLEEASHARQRNADVWGEVLGHGSSCVMADPRAPRLDESIASAARQALQMAGLQPSELGHVHAHGESSRRLDRQEAIALRRVLGDAADTTPVTALKSYMGDACGGSGALEAAASLIAMRTGPLFPVLNHEVTDPECPILPARAGAAAGRYCLNVNVAAEGQASALLVRSAA